MPTTPPASDQAGQPATPDIAPAVDQTAQAGDSLPVEIAPATVTETAPQGPGETSGRSWRSSARPGVLAAWVAVIAGLVLIVVALRAPQLGLATPYGQSWTQVVTGTLGTVLIVAGLAGLARPFSAAATDAG